MRLPVALRALLILSVMLTLAVHPAIAALWYESYKSANEALKIEVPDLLGTTLAEHAEDLVRIQTDVAMHGIQRVVRSHRGRYCGIRSIRRTHAR
jgi:hypothetical protein